MFGDGGAALHYTAAPGTSTPAWQRVASSETVEFFSLSWVSSTEAWALHSGGGSILHYQDGIWQRVERPGYEPLFDLAMVSPEEGWAVGRLGTILHYTDGVWQVVPSPRKDENILTIAMLSPDEGWAGGTANALLHYHDGQWEEVRPAFTLGALSDMEMVSPGEGWAKSVRQSEMAPRYSMIPSLMRCMHEMIPIGAWFWMVRQADYAGDLARRRQLARPEL
jgi:photosystem II stability/assembly factor-like uncharacterized protein